MKCIIKGFYYKHRGYTIGKYDAGICIDSPWGNYPDYESYLFKTFSDARQYIDMIMDSTNTKKPRVVGIWYDEVYSPYYWEMIQSCKRDGCEYIGEGDMGVIEALNKYGAGINIR